MPRYPWGSGSVLAMVGGAAGVTGRYLIIEAAGPSLGRPGVTMIINVAGSVLLGLLLESLVRRGPDRGRRQSLRLLLGTGVLGGFTTYSTLAVEAMADLMAGRLLPAVAVGLGSVVLGVLGAAAGIALARSRHHGPRPGDA